MIKKLKQGWSQSMIIKKQGILTIICFIDIQQDVLIKAWYNSKKQNISEKRFRILKTATAILQEDI